jgi:hypothetical protein
MLGTAFGAQVQVVGAGGRLLQFIENTRATVIGLYDR